MTRTGGPIELALGWSHLAGGRHLANLAAITRNFAATGARTLVMSGAVETAKSVDEYRMAIGGCPLTVVWITASRESNADRLKKHLDDLTRISKAYTLEGIADRITCPTLVLDGENDQFFKDSPIRSMPR